MARKKGLFNISGNIEPQIDSALDARMLVNTIVDLTDTNYWESDDNLIYTYKGMIVVVTDDPTPANNGVYVLLDDDYTNINNWKKIDSDGVNGKHILDDWGYNNSYSEKELVKYKGEILQSLEDNNEDAPSIIGFRENENWKKSAEYVNKVFVLDRDNLHDINFDDLRIWKGVTIHKVNVQNGGSYDYIEMSPNVYLDDGEPYLVIYQRVDDIDMGGGPIDIGKIKTGYVSYSDREIEPGNELDVYYDVDDIINNTNVLNSFILVEDYDKFIENFIDADIMPDWTELALQYGLLTSDENTVYEFIKAPFVSPFDLGEIDIPSDKWLNLNNTRIKGFEERIYNKDEVVCENKKIYRSKVNNNTSNPTDGYSVSSNWEEFTTEVKYGFYNIGEDQNNPGQPNPITSIKIDDNSIINGVDMIRLSRWAINPSGPGVAYLYLYSGVNTITKKCTIKYNISILNNYYDTSMGDWIDISNYFNNKYSNGIKNISIESNIFIDSFLLVYGTTMDNKYILCTSYDMGRTWQDISEPLYNKPVWDGPNGPIIHRVDQLYDLTSHEHKISVMYGYYWRDPNGVGSIFLYEVTKDGYKLPDLTNPDESVKYHIKAK